MVAQAGCIGPRFAQDDNVKKIEGLNHRLLAEFEEEVCFRHAVLRDGFFIWYWPWW